MTPGYTTGTVTNSDWVIVVYNSTGYATGDPWPYSNWPTPAWSVPPPSRWRPRTYSNPLRSTSKRRWPCATATPPGPPPVPMELVELDEYGRPTPTSPERRGRPLMRLHARQSVPSRTRRKLRTWERHAALSVAVEHRNEDARSVAASDPRCPTCDRAMPTLDDVAVSIGEGFDQDALVAVTFHVRCRCGEEVGLCMRTEGDEQERDVN